MSVKPIRYHKSNGALFIGGANNKLAVFTRSKRARLHLGNRCFHFGKWGN